MLGRWGLRPLWRPSGTRSKRPRVPHIAAAMIWALPTSDQRSFGATSKFGASMPILFFSESRSTGRPRPPPHPRPLGNAPPIQGNATLPELRSAPRASYAAVNVDNSLQIGQTPPNCHGRHPPKGRVEEWAGKNGKNRPYPGGALFLDSIRSENPIKNPARNKIGISGQWRYNARLGDIPCPRRRRVDGES